ncbi:hypothetical protein K469DRAFT_707471 [Zopfia rhizophila CBS 207.26]|uniref:P-loop containing nucleoside triphosphate hydrolase protein n=1 Tax=Zopfia rhizophila CBS 207.26 TaxID=1314779 RepID=A0A6A6E1G8_9PEZI|nr:hypothetical protein K469DRAFT_707471 [Zopfia rhizophila CBS 207.26]
MSAPEDVRQAKPSMPLIVFSGYPGVGKYSVAIALRDRIPDSRFFDNHLLIDPVAALLEREDEGYQDFRRALRVPVLEELAKNNCLRQRTIITTHYQQVKRKGRPVDSHEFMRSAVKGDRPFVSIILDCEEEENIRRLVSRPKSAKTKLTDPEVLLDLRNKHVLYSFDADEEVVPKIAGELRLNVEHISAEEAADKIMEFLNGKSIPLSPEKKEEAIRQSSL